MREIDAALVWLVLKVDDYMDAVDPMGLAEGRYRPHEYSPEIPDFINMILNDTVSVDGINRVFQEYFDHPLGPQAPVTAQQLANGLQHIRGEWLAYLERTERPGH